MRQHEELMYQIIAEICKQNAPIVFKGALITKLILAENNFTALDRPTVDIDANWVEAPPSMDELERIVNQSLQAFGGEFYAKAVREYGEKKSAGISVLESATGRKVIAIDISIKPVAGSRLYHFGEAAIKGVLANEILADKLTVISQKLIFRRAKDVVDVYALAHCVKVMTTDIYDIFKSHLERTVGTFDEFFNRRADIEHAYNRLAGIEGKPDFGGVYAYLEKFVAPFARRDETPRLWNSTTTSWDTPVC